MKHLAPLIILLALMPMSCQYSRHDAKTDTSHKERIWFEKGPWRSGLDIEPDETIDIDEFYKQYHDNHDLWTKAFAFLGSRDLKTLTPGKYDLAGDSLFAIVQEYVPKNEDETRFEAHRKYADIQYVMTGEEQIGLTGLENTSTLEPYKEADDIGFYSAAENHYRRANPERFFIFFPQDAHRPCVRTDNADTVKKVVIKVMVK